MITDVELETIDLCQARCVMCPYKDTPHTGKTIDNELFKSIIYQIADQINKKRISHNVKFHLEFQNEPLLDSDLIERTNFIRHVIPSSYILIVTNGLLLSKYKEQIARSNINEVKVSLYGYNAESYNEISGLNITEEKFKEIKNSIKWLELAQRNKIKVMNAWLDDSTIRSYSSRAGFYTKNEILHSQIYGCSKHRDDHLMIRHDGIMPLCCMDWKQEVVVGDLKDQTLEDVLTSRTYNNAISKVNGTPSSDNWICKRCEWAISNPQNRVIITAASYRYDTFIREWIDSLRILGQWTGEIAVIDYGMSDHTLEFLKRKKVNIIKSIQRREKLSSASRLYDIQKIAEEMYSNYYMAYFDVDIWFQDDINNLFDMMNLSSFYIVTHRSPPSKPYPVLSHKLQIESMLEETYQRHDSYISHGFFSGHSDVISSKLRKYQQLIDQNIIPNTDASYHLALNLISDNTDFAIDAEWNSFPFECVFENNQWYRVDSQKLVKGFHVLKTYHNYRAQENTRYYKIYNKDFKSSLVDNFTNINVYDYINKERVYKEKSNKKSLIYTSAAGEDFSLFVLEWAISLRTLGQYKGEALIIDYGLDPNIVPVLKSLNISVIQKNQLIDNDSLVTTRYIDIIDIIENNYSDHHVAHFDADIWFQDNINSLFENLNNESGFASSAEQMDRVYERQLGPSDKSESIDMTDKYRLIAEKYGGHINGGFIAANDEVFVGVMKSFRDMLRSGWTWTFRGGNQYALNRIFSFDHDRADYYAYNTTIDDARVDNNIYYHSKTKEKIVGVHAFSKIGFQSSGNIKQLFRENENRFSGIYPNIYNQYVPAYLKVEAI